jgi:DNA-binding CsgD family transcriptional regulator
MIRGRDAEAALGIVALAARTEGPTPFPLEVIEPLKRLIGADRAGYVEYRAGKPPNVHDVETPRIDVPPGFWQSLAGFSTWVLRDPLGRGSPRVKAVSEVLSRSQRRRNPFFRDVSAPLDVEDEMKIWLPAPQGEARLFFFCRGRHSRDFGDREYMLASLFAPQFAELRHHWEAHRRTGELSTRELEVLGLVGRGLTNQQIAAELIIAPGTVRKHLDHIYQKLDVHTRTAAAMSIRQTRLVAGS